MAKKSKKQTVVKTVVVQQTAKKKTPKAKKGKQSSVPSKLIHDVCALTDPFCKHSIGSKWPDTSSLSSLPFTVKGSYTLDLNSSGVAATVLCPSLSYGYSIGTVVLGVSTYPAMTAFPNISAITSSISQFRLVSGGISVNNLVAPLNASGYVFLKELSPGGNADLTTSTIGSTSETAWVRQPLNVQKPISYVFKPGGNDSRRFRGVNGSSSISSVDSNEFTMIEVSVVGGPTNAAAAIVIDYVMHFEIVFKAGDAMNLMTTPSRGSNEALAQLATNTYVEQPAFLSGTQEVVSNNLSNVVMTMVRGAKPVIKGLVSKGVRAYAGPMAGMIMDGAMSGL